MYHQDSSTHSGREARPEEGDAQDGHGGQEPHVPEP